MRRFDHFACIDWSGAKGRWQRGIAIATCDTGHAAPKLVPPPAQHWTRKDATQWIAQQAKRNILIGLDLSFALPFCDLESYFPGWPQSPPSARALWQLVDQMSGDDENFGANTFIENPEIARHFRQQRNCGDLFGPGRGRLRMCEALGQGDIAGINPYSCFNLVGAAQVGKSSLTGMRVLHQLGRDIPVWPFDPLPAKGPVIVEIYTSIAARASQVLAQGRTKISQGSMLDAALQSFDSNKHIAFTGRYTDHATDAILTAAWMRFSAEKEHLWQPKRLKAKIAATEGWTFGVV